MFIFFRIRRGPLVKMPKQQDIFVDSKVLNHCDL